MVVLGPAVALAILVYLFIWRRARLRWELRHGVLHLRTRILGFIPFVWRVSLTSVVEVRHAPGMREVREALTASGFLAMPVFLGAPGEDMVIVRRKDGFHRVVVAFTADPLALTDLITRALGEPRA